jgi:hypothetical protein
MDSRILYRLTWLAAVMSLGHTSHNLIHPRPKGLGGGRSAHGSNRGPPALPPTRPAAGPSPGAHRSSVTLRPPILPHSPFVQPAQTG